MKSPATKRLVESDGQRGQKIAEYPLQGQCDRDAADSETGGERRDVDAEILKGEEQRQRPDRDLAQRIENRQRAPAGFVALGFSAQIVENPDFEKIADPGGSLKQQRQDRQPTDDQVERRIQVQQQGRGEHRNHQQKECAGPPDAGEKLSDQGIAPALEITLQGGDEKIPNEDQQAEQSGRRYDGQHPVAHRIAVQLRIEDEFRQFAPASVLGAIVDRFDDFFSRRRVFSR